MVGEAKKKRKGTRGSRRRRKKRRNSGNLRRFRLNIFRFQLKLTTSVSTLEYNRIKPILWILNSSSISLTSSKTTARVINVPPCTESLFPWVVTSMCFYKLLVASFWLLSCAARGRLRGTDSKRERVEGGGGGWRET